MHFKFHIYCHRCYGSCKCSSMAIGQGCLHCQEIMNRSFWHRFANKSWKLCRSKVMKRCKAEYLLIKMILLKCLICKDLPFTLDYSDYQRKCLSCIHYMHFGWVFLCHLEGCDSINFIDKKIPYFILSYYLE